MRNDREALVLAAMALLDVVDKGVTEERRVVLAMTVEGGFVNMPLLQALTKAELNASKELEQS